MKYALRIAILAFVLPCLLSAQPLVDHHQHLLSPDVARFASLPHPVTAKDLIAMLDAAGIEHALVLSQAYQFGNPNRHAVTREYAHVRAENDWTAHQVAAYPKRLRAFCAVDPLKDYAVSEIARCAKNPYLRRGLKLHFGNSDVDLANPHHLEMLRRTFRAANAAHMAIAVHMHANINHHRPYGAKQAQIFLDQLLPAAPDVPIQIAHLAGAGGYDDPTTDEALLVFIHAIANQDPRMSHVYFDIAVAGVTPALGHAQLIATRARQIGFSRILYGSDAFGVGDFTPIKAIAAFHQIPFTPAEFHVIETNVAPWMH